MDNQVLQHFYRVFIGLSVIKQQGPVKALADAELTVGYNCETRKHSKVTKNCFTTGFFEIYRGHWFYQAVILTFVHFT